MAWTRATPRASCPVVGSSRTTTGVSHREDRGEGEELASRVAEVVRVGARIAGQAGRLEGRIDSRCELRTSLAEIPGSELHLGADAAGEDLAIGILEGKTDDRGQVGDASSPDVLAVDRAPRPRVGRRSPLKWRTSVDFPEPFWPMIATDSPSPIASETPSTARVPSG